MKLTGDEIAQSVRDWARDEIKSGTKDLYDLGKFLFTVSSASAALLCTAAKLNISFVINNYISFSLFLYALSIGFALELIRPKWNDLTGNLFLLHRERVDNGAAVFLVWLLLWALATIFGIYSIFR